MFYTCEGVTRRSISIPSFNSLSFKLTEIAPFISLMSFLVESMMSSVLSFAYFTNFYNLNIAATNTNISKQ